MGIVKNTGDLGEPDAAATAQGPRSQTRTELPVVGLGSTRRRRYRRSTSGASRSPASAARGGLGLVFEAHDRLLGRRVALKQPQHRTTRRTSPASCARRSSPRGCSTPPSCRSTTPASAPSASPAIRHAPGRRAPPCATPSPARAASTSGWRCCPTCRRWPTPSPTPTARGSCTATSSRPTCWWGPSARRWSSTGGWPRTCAVTIPTTTSAATCPAPSTGGRRRAGSPGPARSLGTPGYMPPEQAARRGASTSAPTSTRSGRSSIHLLTGAGPLRAARRPTHPGGPPPPVDAREPGAPRDLAAIVGKAMARERHDRYPTAQALAHDLKRFATGQLVGARRYSTWALARRWVAPPPGHRAGRDWPWSSPWWPACAGASLRERNRTAAENNRLRLMQAQAVLERDPTAAAAWLKTHRVVPGGEPEAVDVAARARRRRGRAARAHPAGRAPPARLPGRAPDGWPASRRATGHVAVRPRGRHAPAGSGP